MVCRTFYTLHTAHIATNENTRVTQFYIVKQVFGSITKPLIEAVLLRNAKPAISDATDIPSLEELTIPFLDNGDDPGNNHLAPKASSLRLLITNPTRTVHYWWRKFDDKFMRPVFGGRGFVPFIPSSPTGAADGTSEARSSNI